MSGGDMLQGHLFGPPDVVRRHPCEMCGGLVVVKRTADPYEDTARCTGCGTTWTISHSRAFGPRHEARS